MDNNDQELQRSPEESKPVFEHNNPEAGKTYWEVGYQQQMGGRAETGEPADGGHQNGQPMESADDGHQIEQPMEPAGKKRHGKPIAAVIIILLLISVGSAAFAYRNEIQNFIALSAKSPEEYYAYVENRNTGRIADALVSGLKANKPGENTAYHITSDITYDKDTVSSLIKPMLGMTVEDLESYIGLPLNSLGVDMTVAAKDSDIYESFKLNLNRVDLITAELFLSSLNNDILIRLPELSPAYLRQSPDLAGYGAGGFDFGKYEDELDLIYSDETADFIKRYAEIATARIKDVKLTKGKRVKIDKLSADYNMLTVTIDSDTLKDIANEILDEAENDKYILRLLPLFGVTEADYLDGIKNARNSLKEISGQDGEIIMKVYVDGSGNIIGRKIESQTEGDTQVLMEYTKVGSGNKEEYEFYIGDGTGKELVRITGDLAKDGGAYHGKATGFISTDDTKTISITVEYEDVRIEMKDGRQFVYGTYSIASPSLLGTELLLELDAKDNVQQIDLSFRMGSASLVTLHMTSKRLKDYKLPAPDSSATIYDAATDSEGYLATFDTERFISELSDKLGVDLQGILDGFLPSYSY